eukprot:SAG25_NODE_23_length_22180_cov_132.152892_10_plen_61_part_00
MYLHQSISGVNVFKPGKGTITVWENKAGKRGDQIYTKTGIPLTPGPLVTVRVLVGGRVND